MKKAGVFILFILLINLLTIVLAQDIDSHLPPEIKKIEEAGEKFQSQETATEYLKEQWVKIIQNSKAGKAIGGFFTKLNPFWKIVLGIEFSWSFVFFISFFIWVFLFFLIYSLLVFLSGFSKKITKFWKGGGYWIYLLASLFVTVLVAYYGFVKFLSNFLINQINLIDNLWAQIMLVSVLAVVFIFAIVYSRLLRKFTKDTYEKEVKPEEIVEAKLSGGGEEKTGRDVLKAVGKAVKKSK